jgi:hypothetical protein
MARIRTIKPEFPQSESMGRVQREARLCFILLWTLADDEGRLRGNSRMLASLLFPYDDDAKDAMPAWLDELEAENCIERYEIDGDTYIQVAKWLSHQKIDKPSASKIPPNPASSRAFAKPREDSSADQGRDQGEEGKGEAKTSGRSPQSDDCPHQAIIDLYHELLPTARGIRDWTPARAANLRQRWREDPKRQDLDWWRRFFGYIAESSFLTGKTSTPGRKPFSLSLDWLVKAENFAKVREGAYHEQEQAA